VLDLVVVGGGFWGTAAALQARRRGLEAVVLDCRAPQGASKAAAGLVHKDGFGRDTFLRRAPAWWDADELGWSLEWLKEVAGLRRTGEWFFNGDAAGAKYRPDCWLAPPVNVLLEMARPLFDRAERLEPAAGGWAVATPGTTYKARLVVVAAGALTDRLLEASGLRKAGVEGLPGRGYLFPGTLPDGVPQTTQVRPYTSFTVRPWGERTLRLGDTVERGDGPRPGDLNALRSILARWGGGGRMEVCGVRPVCPRFVVEPWAPGLVVAVGGHRVGLGLAGAVGRRCLQLLEVTRG
jgi:glycine/D-amino acid oxidase-like deaminating enzyme